MAVIETDVLIIGTGIGGITAALELASAGIAVTAITRAFDPKDTNTNHAQGGIIYQGEDDAPEYLAADIERAGSFITDPRAVKVLSEQGPTLVKRILIDRLQVPFDREEGKLSLALEGGHAIPRIIHWADRTGRAIQEKLAEAIENEANIKLLTSSTLVDLITPAHNSQDASSAYEPLSCVGAYVLNQDTGEVDTILAKKTILATGGLGQIYLHSTNPIGARGDGIAIASRAGARTENLEYIQFHPTAFYHPDAPRFLISEAVRGDGAVLVNQKGEAFMENYDPERKDLAPRDIVARAIYNEMLTTDSTNVFLDLSSISTERILKHFPNTYAECLKYGIDITKDSIPVVPAAHYSCGGVWVNEWGQTTIEGLYAVGEVTNTGLHGANRLASTSLLEGLVWGARAASHIIDALPNLTFYNQSKILPWQSEGSEADPVEIASFMHAVKEEMWNNVGLVRTTEGLEEAMLKLTYLNTDINQFYQNSSLSDELLGLRNIAQTALLVASAAMENKQSIGSHYRQS